MVSYYIFCHACHIPFIQSMLAEYRNPNITLHFDAALDSMSCSTELQFVFDTDKYDYLEKLMNPRLDYILSFNDEFYSGPTTSLKMFGLFDENQKRIEIGNVTNGNYNDVLLSNLLKELVPRNTPVDIYCSFCRNACASPVIPPIQQLEFSFVDNNTVNNEMQDFDVSNNNLENANLEEDIDFSSLFGGKRKYYSSKKSRGKNRYRKTIAKKRFLKKKNTKKHSTKRKLSKRKNRRH